MARGYDDWCMICERYYRRNWSKPHQCNPKVLRAIDAAHRRATDDDHDEEEPNEKDRLEVGFAMMEEDF